MSEFTDGLLVLKEHAPLVQAALAELKHPYIYKDLNEKWSVIALEQPDDPAYPWVLQHSHDFPMLWFESGDGSWMYIIFHEGKEKASIEIGSALDYSLWRQIAELLYPDLDPHRDLAEGISKRIYELVFASDAYEKSVREQYTYANVDEFTVFGLSPDRIAELKETLQPELAGRHEPDRVNTFKEIISIRELYWIYSYDDLKRALEEGLL